MIFTGTRFFTWGSERTERPVRCGRCGAVVPFVVEKGMRCITLLFIIPVFPLGGVQEIARCPNCGARYQATGAAWERGA